MSFLDEINKAYQKGINNPKNAKAIQYVQEVSKDKNSVEKFISQEIADERE